MQHRDSLAIGSLVVAKRKKRGRGRGAKTQGVGGSSGEEDMKKKTDSE